MDTSDTPAARGAQEPGPDGPDGPDGAAGRDARIGAILARGRRAAEAAFDESRHLVGHPAPWAPGKTVYRPPVSLWYAHALLHQGGEADRRRAAGIVGAALDSQERHPDHPHRGNFLWLADDAEVVDLNAVQFVLRALVPLLADFGDRLPPGLLERCREAVRLALAEQERLAVAPTYTNIHLMSLFALVVGGEWLGDERFASLGRARWARWVGFTAGNGAPHEFNSPGYGAVDLSALAALGRYARDPLVALQARLLYERLWLHLALHLHPPTGQQAGPHCRCYWPMMTGVPPAVHELLWREAGTTFSPESAAGAAGAGGGAGHRDAPASLELALTDHWLPDAVRAWLTHHGAALPAEVRETADRADGQALTTYLTAQYALGTATRTYAIGQDDFYIEHQANYLLLHYRRPPSPADPRGWGLVYSRYVVNDRHAGTLGAAPDRPTTSNFYDQGNFAGAQLRNKAIALYALEPQHQEVFSLKTVVVFPAVETLEEVWLGDRRVASAAAGERLENGIEVPAGEWVVVADGEVFVGVYPLAPSRLGREAPVLLERGPAGELWLTAYNYRSAAKRFWDYASLRGAFWRGNLRAGYVLEVAERDRFASAGAFLVHLRRAIVRDVTSTAEEDGPEAEGAWPETAERGGREIATGAAPGGTGGAGTVTAAERTNESTAGEGGPVAADAVEQTPLERTVSYASGGETLELRYDLWRTRPIGRRRDGALDALPALDSPLAVQGDAGTLRAGSATLRTDPGTTVWLIAQELDSACRSWAAVNPQGGATSLHLETPLGAVTAARWTAGRIELRAPAGGRPELLIDALEAPLHLGLPAGVAPPPDI